MDIEKRFREIRIYTKDNKPSLHKPVLLLFALSQCYQNQNRLIPFETIDRAFQQIFKSCSLGGKAENSYYPFGRLENDGIWEITESKTLQRTAVGHLFKGELISKQIRGGFIPEIYGELIINKPLILKIAHEFLHRYFAQDLHAALLSLLMFGDKANPLPLQIAEAPPGYRHHPLHPPNDEAPNKKMVTTQNGYIAYLNSLHSLSANSANALAESQATNRYFAELYQAFPIVDTVLSALQDDNRVVMLTGHAGDGKSTIALDVFRRLKKLPVDQPLKESLKEREEISDLLIPVTILKDMSELSALDRLRWLQEAFEGSGSWLLISNTGKLLDSLGQLADKYQGRFPDWENRVLALLDTPYMGTLDDHFFDNSFNKDVLIFNLTRLNNVDIVAQVLGKMLNHTAWADCAVCPVKKACPLQLNRRALLQTGSLIQDRVRWVYQRLSQYEQRLTFRQMVAHLALSLTGGMTCNEAKKRVDSSTADGLEKGVEGLAQILFSESFFGYRNGKPWPEAERLRAVALARRLAVGGPMAVDYDRQLCDPKGVNWAELPEDIALLGNHWREKAINENAVRWRFALRRLLYIFGLSIGDPNRSNYFADNFLQSPRLRDFDRWQREQRLTLSESETNKLLKACLRVLLECYSGFSAGQFQHHDRLYLTLRRTDRDIAQPTQLVIASIPFDAFHLEFDKEHGLLLLKHRFGEAGLRLGLPLLDYIQNRDAGELGTELARIHLMQLGAFRANLLNEVRKGHTGEIALLRADINGEVTKHSYLFDSVNNTLEMIDG